jgi:large subunit ribosomal protein L3
MATKAIVGEKIGMTQVWDDDNRVVPVTVLKVAPPRIVQVKTTERDGYSALQVTYGHQDPKKLTKPEAGHFAKANVQAGVRLVELRLEDIDGYAVGQELTADISREGERVDVTAVSRGKGWAGVMKRHNFKGQGASHGNHKHHRAPGSIGACAVPAKVFKGTRMAGHMGAEQVTTLNLEVVYGRSRARGDPREGLDPGPRGGVVICRDAVKAPKKEAADGVGEGPRPAARPGDVELDEAVFGIQPNIPSCTRW